MEKSCFDVGAGFGSPRENLSASEDKSISGELLEPALKKEVAAESSELPASETSCMDRSRTCCCWLSAASVAAKLLLVLLPLLLGSTSPKRARICRQCKERHWYACLKNNRVVRPSSDAHYIRYSVNCTVWSVSHVPKLALEPSNAYNLKKNNTVFEGSAHTKRCFQLCTKRLIYIFIEFSNILTPVVVLEAVCIFGY